MSNIEFSVLTKFLKKELWNLVFISTDFKAVLTTLAFHSQKRRETAHFLAIISGQRRQMR